VISKHSKEYGSLFMNSFPFWQETDSMGVHIILRREAR